MGMLDRIVGSPQDRFAREVMAAIRAAGAADAEYDPGQFAVRVRRESRTAAPTTAYLANLFHECGPLNRVERRERIARHLASVIFGPGAPKHWDDASPLLRPVLRRVTFGQGVPTSGPQAIRRPALPNLSEFVAVDLPTSMLYVTDRMLADWGVPVQVAFDRARQNLAGKARVDESAPDSQTPPRMALVRMVETDDAYWASRLLLDGWLAGQARYVGGRPVAFVPDTGGLLLVADDSDSEHPGLPKIFELVESEWREAIRKISPQAYTVDDAGRVIEYEAPPGHPLHIAVHRASVLLAAVECGTQASHLQTDAFVAELLVVSRPDGTVFSATSWAETVDTLLPRADFVSFAPADGKPFFVPWDLVAREVDLVAEPDLAPERFRLRSWPHPIVVERLRLVAVAP